MKKLNKKQKITAGIIVGVFIIGGGGTYGVMAHQAQVHAQQVENEKAQKAAYEKLQKKAKAAVEKSKTSLTSADFEAAEQAINQLKSSDQKELKNELNKFEAAAQALSKATALVVTAEKAKTEATVNAAQKTVSGLDKTLLVNQMKALQTRLDKVKKTIADAKTAAEKKAKEAAQAKAASEAKTNAEQANTSDTSNSSNTYNGSSNAGSNGYSSGNSYAGNTSNTANSGSSSSNNSNYSGYTNGGNNPNYHNDNTNSQANQDRIDKENDNASNQTQPPTGWVVGGK